MLTLQGSAYGGGAAEPGREDYSAGPEEPAHQAQGAPLLIRLQDHGRRLQGAAVLNNQLIFFESFCFVM